MYSNRVNYESKEVEFPHSTSFNLIIQDSLLIKKYNLAKTYYNRGKYSEALRIAFSVAETNISLEEKVKVYELIGDIFIKSNNHNRAIENYRLSLGVYKKHKNLKSELLNFNKEKYAKLNFKIGAAFQQISRVDSSLYYFNKVLSINTLNDKINLIKANTFNNLSTLFRETDSIRNLDLAKNYINRAINIHKNQNEYVKIAASYGNLANIYMEEGKYNEAKKLYIEALDFIENLETTEAVKYREALYYNLAWTLFNQKNYMSYHYLEQSVIISDSLKNIDIIKATEKLQLEHNIDLATKNAEAKTLLAEKNALEAKENTWLVGGVGIGIALLLMVLVNYYKLRQRNLSLKLSENELTQQKNIEKIKTDAQTKILNATLDGKEVERKLIAETLHDNVSAMLSSANLHLQASQKQFNGNVPVELKKTQEIIKEASKQIRDLSHNLVSSVLLKFGLEYAVKDIAEKYSNSMLSIHVEVKDLKRYNKDSEIKVYNIIQELINNIIKHSKATNTYVKLYEENNNLNLSIKDDGIGFDKNDAVIKNSVGLNQIDARIKMLNGYFFIDTKKDKGTEAKIFIPLIELEEVNLS